jgi:hypothetical protein
MWWLWPCQHEKSMSAQSRFAWNKHSSLEFVSTCVLHCNDDQFDARARFHISQLKAWPSESSSLQQATGVCERTLRWSRSASAHSLSVPSLLRRGGLLSVVYVGASAAIPRMVSVFAEPISTTQPVHCYRIQSQERPSTCLDLQYTDYSPPSDTRPAVLPAHSVPSALHWHACRPKSDAMASTLHKNNPHNELMSALSTSVHSLCDLSSHHLETVNWKLHTTSPSWAVLTLITDCTSVESTAT